MREMFLDFFYFSSYRPTSLVGQNANKGIYKSKFINYIRTFLGPRYVSWLPSFSVQVMSTIGAPEMPDTQFETMARQVSLLCM